MVAIFRSNFAYWYDWDEYCGIYKVLIEENLEEKKKKFLNIDNNNILFAWTQTMAV